MGNLERLIQEDHDFVVDALGEHGPSLLRNDANHFGVEVEQFGQLFLENAVDQLSLAMQKLSE